MAELTGTYIIPAQKPKMWTVSGKVTDINNGNPINGYVYFIKDDAVIYRSKKPNAF